MTRLNFSIRGISRRWRRRDVARHNEAGDTLIEVLLALIVLGMASVALLIAFGTSISASAEHRSLATYNAALASASQEAISAIQNDSPLFASACSNPIANYPSITLPSPYTNYTVQYAATNPVEYWNGTSFQTGCLANEPQLITLGLAGTTYTNSFVVDYPLSSASTNENTGPATSIAFIGSIVGSSAGVPFDSQPEVEVIANGQPVTTDLSPVTLSISSGSGTLSGCSGSESGGFVIFSGCTISSSGTFTLTATDGNLTSAPSNSFSVSASTYHLAFTTQPGAAASGATLSQLPVVKVENASNTPVSWQGNITFTVSGGTLSNCAGLSGTQAVTVATSNGVATLPSCMFAGGYFYNPVSKVNLPTPYTFTASASGLPSTISQTFSVSGPGVASQLIFSTQPTGVASNSSSTGAFTGQPSVTVEDAFGNIVTTYVNSGSTLVSLSISGGETMSGCTSSTSYGVITYSGCHGNAYGTGLTLTASATGVTSATSTSFNISRAASQLVFTTQPSPGVSGTLFITQPVIAVEDSTGTVVTSFTSAITLASLNAATSQVAGTLTLCSFLTPTEGIINVSGCTFAGVIPTNYELQAAVTSLSLFGTSASFTPTGPGIATQLAVTSSPVAGASESVFTNQPVVKFEDSAGNVVTSSTATISLATIDMTTGQAGGTLSGCTGLTAAAGVVNATNCTFAGVVGRNYILVASSGSLTPASSGNFSPTSAGAPSQLAFTTQPVAGASQSAFTTQPSVSVEDQYNNIVTTSSAVISVTSTGGTFTSCVGTTSLGVLNEANCVFAGLVGTGYNLTATSSGLASATSATFTPSGSGPATKLGFTTQPVGGASQSTFATQPVVSVQDYLGNTVTASSATISLTSSGGTLSACSNLTASAGVVNVANCTFAGIVGTNYTLTATSGSLTSTTSSNFSPSGSGPATKLIFTTQPVAGLSGAAFTTQPVVLIEDVLGNLVTSSSSTITLTSSGGTLASCSGLTATGGVVNVSGCTFAGLVGTNYTITASFGTLTSSTSSNFSPSGVGGANKLIFTTQPVAGLSGSVFSTQPVLRVQDSGGNNVTSSATITLSASGGILSSCSGLTASGGIVNVTACTFSGLVGTNYTLTASSGSLVSATSNTFSPTGPGTGTKLIFTTLPSSSATGGTAFATQPSVSVEDAGGNVVPSNTTNVTLTATGGGGSPIVCTANPKAAVAGVATFSNCSLATASGSAYTLTATDGSLSSTTASVTVSVGAPSQVAFTTDPSTTATGGTAFTVQPTVSVEDAGGNVVTSDTSSVTLTASGGGGSPIVCTANPKAAVAGVATFSGCSLALASGSAYTITASDGTLATDTDPVTITTGAASKLVFTTVPSANAVSAAGFATQPSVSVEDAGGNLVTGNTSNVTLTASGGGGSAIVCTTNPKAAVAGVATFSNCSLAKVGTYTITATDGALTSTATTVTVSPAAAAKLIFTTPPSTSATGGTNFAIQPVVTVEDASGNTVVTDSSNVTLAASGGGGSALSCNTNPQAASSGVATFAGCDLAKSSASPYTITATDGTLTSTTAPVTVSVGAAAQLAFTTAPSATATGGTAFATQPSVSIEDAGGNVVTGNTTSVTLTATSGGGSAIVCTTNPKAAVAGVASFLNCSLNKSSGTAYTITATATGLTSATTLVTVSTGVSKVLVFTTPPSGNATGGTAFATQPVVSIEDAGGNVVTTDTSNVSLAATSGGGSKLECTATTTAASSGVATFAACNLNKASGTSYTITATDGSLTSTTSSVTVSVGAANQLIFTTSPGPSTSGSNFGTQPVVTVVDAGGNTVTSSSASITLTASSGTFTCTATTKSATSGVDAFASCKDTGSGSVTLTATSSGLTSAVSASFVLSGGSQLVFTTSPGISDTGLAMPVQPVVKVENATGTVITTGSYSVTLTVNSGTGTGSCTTNPVTTVNGVATFAGCQITGTGTFTIAATATGLTSATSASFGVG